jgi:hypothetical protein
MNILSLLFFVVMQSSAEKSVKIQKFCNTLPCLRRVRRDFRARLRAVFAARRMRLRMRRAHPAPGNAFTRVHPARRDACGHPRRGVVRPFAGAEKPLRRRDSGRPALPVAG